MQSIHSLNNHSDYRSLNMASTTRILPALTRSFRPSIRPVLRSLPRQSTSSLLTHLPLPRTFSTTPRPSDAPPAASTGTPIGRIDRRLRIVFTCTAPVPKDPKVTHPGADARPCGKRSSHEFSKRSYEKGVVIIQCPECSNRHLIGSYKTPAYPLASAIVRETNENRRLRTADHLHWFSQTPSPGQPTGQTIGSETGRTIEDIMREKGEEVKWIDEGDEGAILEVEAPEDQEVAKN